MWLWPARTQQVRATTTLVDPKKLKADQERAEAERNRGREKLAEKQTKTMRKFGMPPMSRTRLPQQLNAGVLALLCGSIRHVLSVLVHCA